MFQKGWRAKQEAALKRSKQRIVSPEIRAQRAAMLAGEPLPAIEAEKAEKEPKAPKKSKADAAPAADAAPVADAAPAADGKE